MTDSRKKFFLISIVFILNFFLIIPSATAESSKLLSNQAIENGWLFETDKIQVKVTAVTHNIFRITAIPQSKDWPTARGTFVAPIKHPSVMLERFDGKDKFGISAKNATLEILKDSLEIYLIGEDEETKLKNGKLRWYPEDPSYWEVTFLSSPRERNYGIGNPEMGRSGGLMKSFAQATVGNGVTQIPFTWSTAGYGMLVDFEEKGAEWRRSGDKHYWCVPGQVLDFYLFLGDTPYQILDTYTDLTGKPPIPPMWAFGFMMSRWGYSGWEDIRQKWYTFRQKKIPVDVFIYDYDWFVKDWQWNNKIFPKPKENLEEASKLGIKVVGIRKPRVEDGENFKFAKRRNWILAYTKNDLNFSIPEVRSWWWQKHIPAFKDGVVGWWNDEAEQTMTEYYYMVKAERDGMLVQRPNGRVWTINRAFSPGLQRLGAAVWTGDINSSWEDLENQPGTLLNYSMAGMPYGSQDIGGFIGRPSPEMYARWIQQGVFVPVMRAHSQLNSDRWPWAFGSDAEEAVKKAIELRYRLIPYLYSYARQTNQTGAPLMRPLFFEFPDDPQTFDMEDEWLVGCEILVAPILNAGGKRRIYLPAETWYDFFTGKPVEGPTTLSIKAELDEIPIYVREGSILPLGPIIQYTGEKIELPLDIHIYPGKDADFLLYEDDGETYAYEKGQYRKTLLRWKEARRSLIIEPSSGTYKGPRRYLANEIFVHDVDKPLKIILNGRNLSEPKDRLSGRPGWFYTPANRQVRIATGGLSLDNDVLLELDPGADILSPYLSDSDESVRVIARNSLEILAAKGDYKAINILLKRLKAEENLYSKIRIINALAPCHNEKKVFNEFKKLLQAPNPVMQEAILKIIKGYGLAEEYFDSVVRLAFDKNKKVAMLAQEALNSYSGEKLQRYFGAPIRLWEVIGPFDNRGGRGFGKAYPPEKEVDLSASYSTLIGQVKWRTISANNDGIINLLKAFPEKQEDVCAYALVMIKSKNEMEVQLWMGSDDDIRVWLNRELIWSNKIGRALKKDEDKVKVKLKKGNNLLLLKVCQGWGAWEYTLRLVDPDGELNKISYWLQRGPL